ncbi:MFS transporter [Microbacterium sp. W4I20]|uniref:MFS transporter n=1 Tax=Microbacterium sp. W4I20 TaxID=3042262 RepID=UPI0027816A96|nr:glycoside-pentoside-hexuronide (GPH):cation symporter [Microbacterium sp. W4I20]MDQ0728794.1 GPH family glycoside/pentoside/hexuronide:cation symporter [Microbacterium sp. W4I20]
MAKNSGRVQGEQMRAAVALSTEESVTAALSSDAVGEAIREDRSGEKLKLREKLSYGVGDIGANLIFAPVSAFLLFYLTDTVGVGAAIAGTLLLFGRVLDGTLDLIVGTLVDKTRTRWGKARPWILFSTPVLVISFALLFNVPAGLTETGKEIYAFIFYFLCLGVGFVSSNLAYHTLLSVITSDSKTRVSLTVIRTFCAIFTTLVVNSLTIPLLTAFGGGQGGWTATTLIYGGVAAITLLIVFFGTKERVKSTVTAASGPKMPLGKMIRILFRNPYFLLVFGFFLLQYMVQGTAGVGIYFASDVLNDPSLFGLLSIAGLAPLLLGMWFMPAIIGRFGKRKPILFGTGFVVVGTAVTLIDPTNVTLLIIGSLIRAIGGVPNASAMFALVADVIDYGEWKSGVRLDGMTYAAATAGQNFGAGLGTALVGWLLAFGNYDGLASSQPQSAINVEIFLYLVLPGITAILIGVIIYFLNVDKNLSQMQRDLADRRANSAVPAEKN